MRRFHRNEKKEGVRKGHDEFVEKESGGGFDAAEGILLPAS